MTMRDAIIREIPHLRRFAHGLARDADLAEDLVQDCLERALSRETQYDPTRALRPWLFRILRNLFISGRRRAREATSDDATLNAIPDATAGRTPIETIALRQVLGALHELPDEQREVIVLICVEELSYREVADIVGAPIGTVMSRLSRGRSAIKNRCGAQETPRLRRVK